MNTTPPPQTCPEWCLLRHEHAAAATLPDYRHLLHLSPMTLVPVVVRETTPHDGQVLSHARARECAVGLLQVDGETYLSCDTDDAHELTLTIESAQRLITAIRPYLRVARAT